MSRGGEVGRAAVASENVMPKTGIGTGEEGSYHGSTVAQICTASLTVDSSGPTTRRGRKRRRAFSHGWTTPPHQWLTLLVLASTTVASGLQLSANRRRTSFRPPRLRIRQCQSLRTQIYCAPEETLVVLTEVLDETELQSPEVGYDISSFPPLLSSPGRTMEKRIQQAKEELENLEVLLMEREELLNPGDIMKAVCILAAGNMSLLIGTIEFIKVFFRLDEIPLNGQRSQSFVTQEILLAGILHYVECVATGQGGGYEQMRQTPLERDGHAKAGLGTVFGLASSSTFDSPLNSAIVRSSAKSVAKPIGETLDTKDVDSFEPQVDFLSHEVLRLARGASRIKRAEILAELVLSRRSANYDQLQQMLVSVGGSDWRALAIRCVASLYRLEMDLKDQGTMPGDPRRLQHSRRPPKAIFRARAVIKVYAGLSQRMGLQSLKAQLESRAFQILYPRQFQAAVGLFEQRGDIMRALSRYLQNQICQLLEKDLSLQDQLEEMEVTCRVKEPYSYWKKILRGNLNERPSPSLPKMFQNSGHRSIFEVGDGVALRVVLKARMLHPNEPEVDIRAREETLCYEIHNLIRYSYPETDPSRLKDYIKYPKANGYRSLHHTSAIRRDHREIPFEVQVRSREMHRIAEFGVAAHWDYKQNQQLISSQPTAHRTIRMFPATDEVASITNMTEINDQATPRGRGISYHSPYLQALEVARQALVQSSVFCFVLGTSISELVSLDKGTKIIDILSMLKTWVDEEGVEDFSLQAWRNGKLAEWDEQVVNGDVIVFASEEISSLRSQNLNGYDPRNAKEDRCVPLTV